MQQPCIIWELHPSHGGRSVERQKELEVLNRLFLSKCVSAPEGRTSDDAQLLVITEEEICLNSTATFIFVGHCSVTLMGLDRVLQVFQELSYSWIDFYLNQVIVTRDCTR